MASKVIPPLEEEGAEVDGMKEARGVAVLVCGYFNQNWASLHRTDGALKAPIKEK